MAGDELNKEMGAPGKTEPQQEALDGEVAEPEEQDVEARIREAVDAALAEQRDALLRAHAEVQNIRRRAEQDVEKAHKFALERFSADLLTVVDNLERALDAIPEEGDETLRAQREGVEITLKDFLDTLNKHGIAQINPAGEPFDPQLHEAIATQPSDQVEPNTVLDVVQKGYVLNGRVVRPARVLVSKAQG